MKYQDTEALQLDVSLTTIMIFIIYALIYALIYRLEQEETWWIFGYLFI